MSPSSSPAGFASRRNTLAFLLIVSATMLGIAGIDLVLPAVPSLPRVLGGTPALAQLVIAAYVAGTACGLLLLGELGARFDPRRLLVASLLVYALCSELAARASTMEVLIGLRFVQGLGCAAGAVFAPGFINRLFTHDKAVSALGLLGSIEALAPALAPIFGAWLLLHFGWQASFHLVTVLAVLLALAIAVCHPLLPAGSAARRAGGYAVLLRDPVFLRYALSQAFVLGGLLVFVFGAPAVIVVALGGGLGDFIVLQICGISFFILAANLSGRLLPRLGAERLIWTGTLLAACGAALILLYALLGGRNPLVIIAPSAVLNIGLGLRGPTGFHRAVVAAHGDDSRGSALVVLAVLFTASTGTALVAPFITAGLVPLAAMTASIIFLAVLVLRWLPALPDDTRHGSGQA
ncbi:MFS transporter [Uliginosibacterium sp. H1]|uniref:MFS transporter n=1 Tax=Uliginosibacterium sp. H1 TaxID=3114757 RepID=UPI002E16FD27|nr:MFS transporter [Uliginosibacterium sp. H1]